MIKIEVTSVNGFREAVLSLEKLDRRSTMGDSRRSRAEYLMAYGDKYSKEIPIDFYIGPKDWAFLKFLVDANDLNVDFRRFIVVDADIFAPRYWWEEYEDLKGIPSFTKVEDIFIRIEKRPFEFSDFSTEYVYNHGIQLTEDFTEREASYLHAKMFSFLIDSLNDIRERYLKRPTVDTDSKIGLIQMLPSNYNISKTIMTDYENLSKLYKDTRHCLLDEWVKFREWIETLPYSELITGEVGA